MNKLLNDVIEGAISFFPFLKALTCNLTEILELSCNDLLVPAVKTQFGLRAFSVLGGKAMEFVAN